jgi:small subunit ribosomal protein S2
MFKNFFNFNITNLIKIRLHLGHKNNTLEPRLTSYIYGTRHSIDIFNLNKFWKPYRYLFYNLVHIFFKRNSFFIVGTNKNLPMSSILETMLTQYPFENRLKESFYISGYIDRKWIGGLFSNWKIFIEFIKYLENPFEKLNKKYKFQRYFWYLKGIKLLEKNPVPDFVIFLDQNKEALKEIQDMQVPLIGLVDSNMNPTSFLYKFFGNNDTFESIDFFFNFLKEAIQEGRLKEQSYFFFYFVNKIKKEIANVDVIKLKRKRWQEYLHNKKNKKYIFRPLKGFTYKTLDKLKTGGGNTQKDTSLNATTVSVNTNTLTISKEIFDKQLSSLENSLKLKNITDNKTKNNEKSLKEKFNYLTKNKNKENTWSLENKLLRTTNKILRESPPIKK